MKPIFSKTAKRQRHLGGDRTRQTGLGRSTSRRTPPRWRNLQKASSLVFSSLQDIRQTKEYVSFMEKIGWQTKRIQPRKVCLACSHLPTCPHRYAKRCRRVRPCSQPGSQRGKHKNNETMKQMSNETNVFIKKLPLLPFSIIKILRCQPPIPLKEIKKIAKKHKAILVKLQPFVVDKLQATSYKLQADSWPLVPTKTIWINLSKSKENLLKEMKAKTRYNIRKAARHLRGGGKSQKARIVSKRDSYRCKIIDGDKITENQLQAFYSLWSKNKPFNWLFKPSFYELKSLVESFKEKCFFIFAINNQQLTINNYLLASCLILCSKNMAFYWHNCSSKEGKKLFAPTLCVWQAILEAKRRNLKIFDFEGIWDERFPNLNKGWKGFSRFKKGFGGKEIHFTPSLQMDK